MMEKTEMELYYEEVVAEAKAWEDVEKSRLSPTESYYRDIVDEMKRWENGA